jgi:small subunit ribosomal protein S16
MCVSPAWARYRGAGIRNFEEYSRVISLRLRRMGAKKRPSYRIVAADSKSPRDGRFIEAIGFYDPLTEPATITVNEERARHWLSVGAQPSDTVRNILRRKGIVAGGTTPSTGVEQSGSTAGA